MVSNNKSDMENTKFAINICRINDFQYVDTDNKPYETNHKSQLNQY